MPTARWRTEMRDLYKFDESCGISAESSDPRDSPLSSEDEGPPALLSRTSSEGDSGSPPALLHNTHKQTHSSLGQDTPQKKRRRSSKSPDRGLSKKVVCSPNLPQIRGPRFDGRSKMGLLWVHALLLVWPHYRRSRQQQTKVVKQRKEMMLTCKQK